MPVAFPVPRRFCCSACGFKEDVLQLGDVLKINTVDLKCPKCGSVLELKKINAKEHVLYKLGLLR